MLKLSKNQSELPESGEKEAIPKRQARIIIRALEHLKRAPELRREKVAPLLRSVRQRRYCIDCRKLADRLILGLLCGCL